VRDTRKDGYEFYNPEQWEKGKRAADVVSHLPLAIKNGELRVWYQPQVNYATGEITGAEALCRWEHGKLGWIRPSEFIPVLEETGLIYELDSEYKPIRIRDVFNSINDNTYHCFELDGVHYACPFLFNRKEKSRGNVVAVSYKDGKPYYYAFLSENVLFVRFCEYIAQGKALMTEYGYNPVSEYTLHGYPTDPEAPIGALNSPATRVCWEEEPVYTDFSQFFQKRAEDSQP
jgi:hypothetical protein